MGSERALPGSTVEQSPMPSPSDWTSNSHSGSSRSSHSSSSRSAHTSNTSTSTAAPSSLVMTPDEKPPYESMQALGLQSPITSAIRRSLSPETGATPVPSSPSASASGGSEVNDHLSPLPDDKLAVVVAPVRQVVRRPLRLPTYSGQTSKSQMSPSLGLSDLLLGSPHGQDSDSYFSAQYSEYVEPSTPTPPTDAAPRRPAYSPFRSYYGETSKGKKSGSAVSQNNAMRRNSVDETRSEIASEITHKSGPSTGSSSSQSSRRLRGPSVKNTDAVLAPHGSFTSAKTAPLSRSSSRKSQPSRPIDSPIRIDDGLEPAERDGLIEAAASGDQLAMHRLGWRRPQTQSRYTLGTVESVWGTTHNNDHVRRSSRSSQGSTQSPCSSDRRPSPSDRSRKSNSDLLVDAARLARQARKRDS